MSVPRLRMLAGPNGSGKSTLFKDLAARLPVGHWLNPDDVERRLRVARGADFGEWRLAVDEGELQRFVRGHGLFKELPPDAPPPTVRENRLVLSDTLLGTYFNAILCDFLRTRWLAERQTFTFETVMSHPGKLEFFGRARRDGYRTYLYYICTDSPLINRDRVRNRVATGGHDVDPARISDRYHRSLGLLRGVIASAHRAYLFDNSAAGHRLIAEFEEGRLRAATEAQPAWAIEWALSDPPRAADRDD